MFVLGFSLAFTVLHSMLYAFDRRESGNLYLAVSAAGFSLFRWSDVSLGPQYSKSLETFGVLGISIMILGFLRFGHVFVNRPSPKVFGFFVFAATVAVTWQFFVGTSLVPQLVVLLSLVELVRTLFEGARRRAEPRSWLVGLGFTAILVSAALETLSGLGLLPTVFLGTYTIGMLLLFVSLSAYLSLRFADTRKALERRLVEVELLSGQALEQQRQAQEKARERIILEKELGLKRRELEAARDLQLSLLPSEPLSSKYIDLALGMRTASEVGGDYYDIRAGARDSLTLAVGDASGHGLDAGLLVVATKGLFHAGEPASSLLEQLRLIATGLEGIQLKRRFMALSLLRWNHRSLEIVSAGMPPVLVGRQASGRIEELPADGPPLGTLPGHRYNMTRIDLSPGDTVLATSDGLAERLDDHNEQFGYARLREAFGKGLGEPLEPLKDRLFAALDLWAHGVPRGDDETLVILRQR